MNVSEMPSPEENLKTFIKKYKTFADFEEGIKTLDIFELQKTISSFSDKEFIEALYEIKKDNFSIEKKSIINAIIGLYVNLPEIDEEKIKELKEVYKAEFGKEIIEFKFSDIPYLLDTFKFEETGNDKDIGNKGKIETELDFRSEPKKGNSKESGEKEQELIDEEFDRIDVEEIKEEGKLSNEQIDPILGLSDEDIDKLVDITKSGEEKEGIERLEKEKEKGNTEEVYSELVKRIQSAKTKEEILNIVNEARQRIIQINEYRKKGLFSSSNIEKNFKSHKKALEKIQEMEYASLYLQNTIDTSIVSYSGRMEDFIEGVDDINDRTELLISLFNKSTDTDIVDLKNAATILVNRIEGFNKKTEEIYQGKDSELNSKESLITQISELKIPEDKLKDLETTTEFIGMNIKKNQELISSLILEEDSERREYLEKENERLQRLLDQRVNLYAILKNREEDRVLLLKALKKDKTNMTYKIGEKFLRDTLEDINALNTVYEENQKKLIDAEIKRNNSIYNLNQTAGEVGSEITFEDDETIESAKEKKDKLQKEVDENDKLDDFQKAEYKKIIESEYEIFSKMEDKLQNRLENESALSSYDISSKANFKIKLTDVGATQLQDAKNKVIDGEKLSKAAQFVGKTAFWMGANIATGGISGIAKASHSLVKSTVNAYEEAKKGKYWKAAGIALLGIGIAGMVYAGFDGLEAAEETIVTNITNIPGLSEEAIKSLQENGIKAVVIDTPNEDLNISSEKQLELKEGMIKDIEADQATIENRIETIEKELKELKTQVGNNTTSIENINNQIDALNDEKTKELAKLEKLTDDLKQSQLSANEQLAQNKVNESAAKFNNIEEKIDSKASEIEDSHKKFIDDTKGLKEDISGLDEKQTEDIKKLDELRKEQENNIKSLNDANNMDPNDINQNNLSQTELTKEISEQQAKIDELEKQIMERNAEIEKASSQLEDLTKEQEAKIEKLKTEMQDLNKEKDIISAELTKNLENLENIQKITEIQIAEKELSEVNKEINNLNSDFNENSNRHIKTIEALNNTNNIAERSLDILKEQQETNIQKLESFNNMSPNDINSQNLSQAELTKQIDEQQAKIDSVEKQILHNKELIETEKSNLETLKTEHEKEIKLLEDKKGELSGKLEEYKGIETPEQKDVQTPQFEKIEIKIESGDTLSEIALKYGTTVEKIMELKPHIQDPDLIYTGDTIIIEKEIEMGITNSVDYANLNIESAEKLLQELETEEAKIQKEINDIVNGYKEEFSNENNVSNNPVGQVTIEPTDKIKEMLNSTRTDIVTGTELQDYHQREIAENIITISENLSVEQIEAIEKLYDAEINYSFFDVGGLNDEGGIVDIKTLETIEKIDSSNIANPDMVEYFNEIKELNAKVIESHSNLINFINHNPDMGEYLNSDGSLNVELATEKFKELYEIANQNNQDISEIENPTSYKDNITNPTDKELYRLMSDLSDKTEDLQSHIASETERNPSFSLDSSRELLAEAKEMASSNHSQPDISYDDRHIIDSDFARLAESRDNLRLQQENLKQTITDLKDSGTKIEDVTKTQNGLENLKNGLEDKKLVEGEQKANGMILEDIAVTNSEKTIGHSHNGFVEPNDNKSTKPQTPVYDRDLWS